MGISTTCKNCRNSYTFTETKRLHMYCDVHDEVHVKAYLLFAAKELWFIDFIMYMYVMFITFTMRCKIWAHS